jgi:oligopeptide transport system permease protein
MPPTYFSDLDAGRDPLASVTETLTRDQFVQFLSENYIIDIIAIIETPNESNPSEPYVQYKVRVNRFMMSVGQEPDDTYFWFGTTRDGQDLFTELWRGARL